MKEGDAIMWTYCHVICPDDSFNTRKVGVYLDSNNNPILTNYCDYCGKSVICDKCNTSVLLTIKKNPELIQLSVLNPLHLKLD